MKRFLTALLLAATLSTPLAAQEPTPFRWDSHTAIPARISDIGVGLNVGLDAIHSFKAEDHNERLKFICRVGTSIGTTEILKRVIHRTRPDGSDKYSDPSGHTALATTTAGYNTPVGASVTVVVAWGRQAAGKHYGSDVAFGFGVGWFSRWVGEHC